MNQHVDSCSYYKIRFVDCDETAEMVGIDQYHAGQLDSESRHLHPLNFVLGMASAAEEAGARIFQDRQGIIKHL